MTDEQHEAINTPEQEKTPEQIAAETPLDQVSEKMERKVLDIIAAQNGITADALNISQTSFKKMNKAKLAKTIREGVKQPEQKEESATKQPETVDFAALAASVLSAAQKAIKSGDFSDLDNLAINESVGVFMGGGAGESAVMPKSSPYVMWGIVGTCAVYGAARLYGIDKITKKLSSMMGRSLGAEDAAQQ